MTSRSHLHRLCLLAVLTLAPCANDASAQASPTSASAAEDLVLTVPVAAPEDARTLYMLQRRNRVMSGRMAAYAVSLGVGAMGVPLVFRGFCILECDGRFNTKSRAVLGSLLSVLVMGGVIGMTGLITAGSRRQRGQRRIRALTLTPTAMVGRERSGGAAVSLAW